MTIVIGLLQRQVIQIIIEGYLRVYLNDEGTFFGDASFADFSIAFLFRICLESGLRMGAWTPRITITIGLL